MNNRFKIDFVIALMYGKYQNLHDCRIGYLDILKKHKIQYVVTTEYVEDEAFSYVDTKGIRSGIGWRVYFHDRKFAPNAPDLEVSCDIGSFWTRFPIEGDIQPYLQKLLTKLYNEKG